MRELQIIVCIKQIPDPEGPASAFRVDPEAKRVIPVGIPPVINPFDENALEAALRIKEQHSAKVTVISMGEKLAQPVLIKALAAGADELILLEDPIFKDLDSYSTACVLSKAIKRSGTYDLILTGRQAGDWDFGITGLLVAEILQVASINLAQKVEITDDKVSVEKLRRDGYEVVTASMPVLITVSSEIGELRYPPLAAIKAARAKPVKSWNAEQLEVNPPELEARQIFQLSAVRAQRQCRFIEGDSFLEKGERLATILREDAII